MTLKKTSADVLGPDTITVTLATDKKKSQLLHVASSHPGVVVQVAAK